MLKKLIAAAIVLGILLLIGGGALWLQNQKPQPHRFVLSDGSVMTFRQATFGTNHVIGYASGWRAFVPKVFTKWGTVHSTLSPALVLWFERRQMPGSGVNYFCSLVHSDGTETAFDGNRLYANYTPTNTLEGIPAAYPQREKILHVRFYEQKSYDDLSLLGEFTVINPRVSKAPGKTAPALPQTARDGDLEVTLLSFHSGTRERPDHTNLVREWTHAYFQVKEAGRPSTNWQVQRMEAVDSIGNKFESQTWSGESEKGREKFECKPVLWPSEVYKLRFEFSRKTGARFETNEIWTIPDVAMPANGGFTLVETQWNTGKFTTTFHGLSTKGAKPPWGISYYGPEAQLEFAITPAVKDYRFTLVSVTDERGRPMQTAGASYTDSKWSFGLREPVTNAMSIDVTVALHRSRFVEFEAQPAKWDATFSH